MCVIGEVLDVMILVIFPVMGLQWHAIVAHGIGPVLAEVDISTSVNFSIFCPPILIYGVFLDSLPRSTSCCMCEWFLGDALLRYGRQRLLSIRDKYKFAVPKVLLSDGNTSMSDPPAYLIPKDFKDLPRRVETRVSFPRGWLDIASVSGSAFSVVSSI